MFRRKVLLLVAAYFVASVSIPLAADMITVRNESDERCYCAVYYVKGKAAERNSSVTPVAAGESVQMNRPPRKWWHDRELLCRSLVDDLPISTTADYLEKWDSQNIGLSRGSTFHMQLTGDIWRGFNDVHWKVHKAVPDVVAQKVKEMRTVVSREIAETKGKFVEGARDIRGGKVLVGGKKMVSGVVDIAASPWALAYIVARREAKKAFGSVVHPAIRNRRQEYANKVARVREGNELCEGERRALDARLVHIKQVAEERLSPQGNLSVDHLPRIALVASGGGYRAMIMTLGWLVGADREGILDMSSWLVGLSGSVWGIGSWLADGDNTVWDARSQLFDRIEGKSLLPSDSLAAIEEGTKIGGKVVAEDPSVIGDVGKKGLGYLIHGAKTESELLAEALALPILLDQPLGVVDMYGALLANRLLSQFDRGRHRVYLSDQQTRVATGLVPIPIYTAGAETRAGLRWFEFTPWECGATWLAPQGAYVPTWAYGRMFSKGSSVDFAVEKDLGFQFGTVGSAFALSASEAYEHIMPGGSKVLKALFEATRLVEMRDTRFPYAAARVPNFTFKMRGGLLQDKTKLALADAGIMYNLPYPPISGERLERKADMIVFLDASAGTTGVNLCKSAGYAEKTGLPFPRHTTDGVSLQSECTILLDPKLSRQEKYRRVRSIGKEAVTVLPGGDDTPTVIYVPRVNDPNLWSLLDDSGDCVNSGKFASYRIPVRDCQEFAGGTYCDKMRGGFDIEKCTNDGSCGTAKLKYSADLLNQLSALPEFQMRAISDTIIDQIKAFIERKSGGSVTFDVPPDVLPEVEPDSREDKPKDTKGHGSDTGKARKGKGRQPKPLPPRRGRIYDERGELRERYRR